MELLNKRVRSLEDIRSINERRESMMKSHLDKLKTSLQSEKKHSQSLDHQLHDEVEKEHTLNSKLHDATALISKLACELDETRKREASLRAELVMTRDRLMSSSCSNNIQDTSLDTVDGIWRARARALIKTCLKEASPSAGLLESTPVILSTSHSVPTCEHELFDDGNGTIDDNNNAMTTSVSMHTAVEEEEEEEHNGNSSPALERWNNLVNSYVAADDEYDLL